MQKPKSLPKQNEAIPDISGDDDNVQLLEVGTFFNAQASTPTLSSNTNLNKMPKMDKNQAYFLGNESKFGIPQNVNGHNSENLV